MNSRLRKKNSIQVGLLAKTSSGFKGLVNFDVVMVERGGGDKAETRQGFIVIQDRAQFSSLSYSQIPLEF